MPRTTALWACILNDKLVITSDISSLKTHCPDFIVHIPSSWNVSSYHIRKGIFRKRKPQKYLLHVALKNKLPCFHNPVAQGYIISEFMKLFEKNPEMKSMTLDTIP